MTERHPPLRDPHLEEVARCSAELHELLLAPDGPPAAPPAHPVPPQSQRTRQKV